MVWTDVINGFISFLFSLLGALLAIVVSPLDALVNIFMPQSHDVAVAFFTWATTMINGAYGFLNWALYVTGVTPVTWGIMVLSIKILLLLFIMLLPIKTIVSVFRGMR